MDLYHITKLKHLDSILTGGLLINSKKTGFCKRDMHKVYKKRYGVQPIYLTNNLEYITTEMLTSEWVKKAIVLKVNVELNENNSLKGLCENEFVYLLDVKPDLIEVMEYNLLKPILIRDKKRNKSL